MNIEISKNKSDNIFSDVKDILDSITKYINKINYYVADRFEGNLVVCENLANNKILNVKKDIILSSNISEGDVLKLQDGFFTLDSKQTKIRKTEILDYTKDIFENN